MCGLTSEPPGRRTIIPIPAEITSVGCQECPGIHTSRRKPLLPSIRSPGKGELPPGLKACRPADARLFMCAGKPMKQSQTTWARHRGKPHYNDGILCAGTGLKIFQPPARSPLEKSKPREKCYAHDEVNACYCRRKQTQHYLNPKQKRQGLKIKAYPEPCKHDPANYSVQRN